MSSCFTELYLQRFSLIMFLFSSPFTLSQKGESVHSERLMCKEDEIVVEDENPLYNANMSVYEHMRQDELQAPEPIKQVETITFEITAYTSGYESTGKRPGHPAYGITSSGARVKERHTIAADISVLPYGTKVKIEGFDNIFVVEDTGGAIKGRRIDIYMPNLSEALKFGRRHLEVEIIEMGEMK